MNQSLLFDAGLSDHVANAKEQFATSCDVTRGAIYTRREVVEFMLRLCGFANSRRPSRVLEPSCGEGDFLLPIVDKILKLTKKLSEAKQLDRIESQLVGVELNAESFDSVRKAVDQRLDVHGLKPKSRQRLLSAWLHQDDFLLADIPGQFNYVIGNPPYVRQEVVPDALLKEYKRRYSTIYDRADLYVPFIERGLRLLANNGSLAFICADRWTKNKYGGPLRKLVSSNFHLKHFVDMYETDAFNRDVIAYPAITVIERGQGSETAIAKQPSIASTELNKLASAMRGMRANSQLRVAKDVVHDDDPWLVDCPEQLNLVRRLENDFPTLKQADCHVGIGVATGADRVYIGPYEQLPVESSRKLPLVMTGDIEAGELTWRGKGVINPFNEDGSLVNLAKFPKLAAYIETHHDTIARRHVAKKNPERWFRTIDRITPSLTHQPKLLIPDIKGQSNVVYDDGKFYPHHNLYFITSGQWDLRALRAVLISGIAQLFVATYSTRMRGGYFRFQAQYLRRICLPCWKDIGAGDRKRLITAGERGSVEKSRNLAAKIYQLNQTERSILEEHDGT